VTRINVTDPAGKFTGWFDTDKAERIPGPGRTALWHTIGGRWLIERESGITPGYRFITPGMAAQWLAQHGMDAVIARQFGAARPRGRPEIGGVVKVRLGSLLPAVDRIAARNRMSRADVIRHLIWRGLTEEGTAHDQP
jgi:hypothetical protein